jgi:hypothetical protein
VPLPTAVSVYAGEATFDARVCGEVKYAVAARSTRYVTVGAAGQFDEAALHARSTLHEACDPSMASDCVSNVGASVHAFCETASMHAETLPSTSPLTPRSLYA